MTKVAQFHPKTLVSIGIVFYLWFMVIKLPASLILRWAPLPANIKPALVTGTMWNGEIHDAQWNKLTLSQLTWTFKPSYLLIGMPAFHWSMFNNDGLRASGIAGWRWGWHLSKIEARLPAELLQQTIWPASAHQISVAGILHIAVDTLALDNNQCDGNGQITLNPGQIQMDNASLQVNDATLHFACQDNQLDWSLSQQSSALTTKLQGRLDLQGNYSIHGELQPGTTLPANFAAVLPWLGVKNKKNNYYYIDKQGLWNARLSPH